MKHRSIQYWETFPLPNGGWRKLVIETALEENDTARDAFYDGQKEVRNFHYESKKVEEKQMGTHVVGKPEEVFNQEWEDIKTKLLSFDDAETAQKYLDTTSYNMTVEAKQIINSLKTKK